MIQKRDNTFETNSSSTHTLTLNSRILRPSGLTVDKNDIIIIDLKEFGCSGEVKSQEDKLAWCILQAQCDADVWLDPWEDDYYDEDDLIDEDDEIIDYDETDIAWRHNEFIDSDIFKWMSEQICAYTGAKGMKFKMGTKGYIDHQSMYSSIHEFLEEMGVGLLEFIFGDMYLTLDRD